MDDLVGGGARGDAWQRMRRHAAARCELEEGARAFVRLRLRERDKERSKKKRKN
jgi:hypothetical protein